MKNEKITALAILFLLFALSSTAFSQLTFGIRGGINLANVNMKENDFIEGEFSSRFGLNIGGVVEYGINGLAIQTGVSYSQQGGKYKEVVNGVDYRSEENVDAKGNYLTVPVLAKYTKPLNHAMSVYGVVGPYISFLLSGKAEGTVKFDTMLDDITIDEDIKDYTKNTDMGLVFGIGMQKALKKCSLFMDARIRFGLINALDTDKDNWLSNSDLSFKNNVISIVAGILFGGSD